MRDFTEWLRLNMRICLSATLMIEAAIGLIPQMEDSTLPSIMSSMGPALDIHSSALAALYFTLSIWLILGIRTSLVAAMAAVLMIVPAIIASPEGNPALAVKIMLVAIYSMPLILFGGGRYAILETEEPWMIDEDNEDVVGSVLHRKS